MQPQSNATIVNPNRAIVEAQNAERIARRRSAATLSADAARTSSRSLQRGGRRQVGGTFETLQALPSATIAGPDQGFNREDIQKLLSSFQFASSREVLSESRRSVVGDRSSFSRDEINRVLGRVRGGRRRIAGRPNRLFGNISFNF